MPDRHPDADPHPPPLPGASSPLEVEPWHAPPEVHHAGHEVQVTIALPSLDADDLGYYVGSNLVLVWSKSDPEAMRTLVHLPVDVRADSSIVRFTNGVFDLTVLTARAEPSAQAPANASPSDSTNSSHAPSDGSQ